MLQAPDIGRNTLTSGGRIQAADQRGQDGTADGSGNDPCPSERDDRLYQAHGPGESKDKQNGDAGRHSGDDHPLQHVAQGFYVGGCAEGGTVAGHTEIIGFRRG